LSAKISLPQSENAMFMPVATLQIRVDDGEDFDLYILRKPCDVRLKQRYSHGPAGSIILQQNAWVSAGDKQNAETQDSRLRKETKSPFERLIRGCDLQRLLNRLLCFATGPKPELPTPAFESAYIRNCTSSPFHNLPMELILEIASFSSPVTRLIMQRVCGVFRAGLSPHEMAPAVRTGNFTLMQKFQFAFILRQDAQVRLQDVYDLECDLAPPNSSLYQLGCSGCRTIHATNFFSDGELLLAPKVRICKGLAASVRICHHLSFSGLCLVRTLRIMECAEIMCALERDSDANGNFMICLNGRGAGPRVGFHNGQTITIDKVVPILAIGMNDEATHDILLSALRKKRVYICPHMNSDSPEMFGGKSMSAECPDHTRSEIREERWKTSCCTASRCSNNRRGECVTWAQCPESECLTRYCLRRHWTISHGIVLEISRDIIGGPTHPAWLAQLQQKGARTCNRIQTPVYHTPIGIMAATSQLDTNESPKNGVEQGMEKCNTRSRECKGVCPLVKCGEFMSFQPRATFRPWHYSQWPCS
jgi:hypothetical protein